MRVTVCELPHDPRELAVAWARLCDHTSRQRSELVLLPELVFVDPVWEADRFDSHTWSAVVAESAARLQDLPDLRAPYVVGTRPVWDDGRPFNEGFTWTVDGAVAALRRKYFLPAEPGTWENRWFHRGDASGSCGGVGWIISPDGRILATTSAESPCATVDIDLTASVDARWSYPRYVFRDP